MKKLKIIIIILAVLFFLGLVVWGSFESGTTIRLEPTKIETKLNQEFTVNVYAKSPNDRRSFTLRAALRFSPNQLKVENWEFSDGWIALPQPGYDLIDNDTGSIIKTAGFPGGWTGEKLLGVITFSAKDSSISKIDVSGKTFALDSDGANIFSLGNSVKVTVLAPDGSVPSKEEILPVDTINPKDALNN